MTQSRPSLTTTKGIRLRCTKRTNFANAGSMGMESISAFSSCAEVFTNANCRSRHSREPMVPAVHKLSISRQAGSASRMRISSVTSTRVMVPSKSQKMIGSGGAEASTPRCGWIMELFWRTFLGLFSPDALIHQAFGLSPLGARARRQKLEGQPIHAANVIGPNLGITRLQISRDRLLNAPGLNPVGQFKAKLKNIPQTFLPDGHLPVFSDAFHVMKHAFKNGGMHIACSHHHHFIAPTFNHIDSAKRRSAGTRLFQEARHVADAITDERFGAARKRRHHQFAIAFVVRMNNLKQEIELIHVVAPSPPAFHADAAARFR